MVAVAGKCRLTRSRLQVPRVSAPDRSDARPRPSANIVPVHERIKLQLIDGTVVASASDLVRASTCEYAVLRRLDVVLGLGPALPEAADALMARAAELGDQHEAKLVEQLDDVVAIGRRNGVPAAAAATLEAVAEGAPVITQAVFFDGRMLGIADFLIRQADGSYRIADAKLARREKTTAVLQIAIYAELAAAAGVQVDPLGALLLGDGREFTTPLDRYRPVARARRHRLESLIRERSNAGVAIGWDDQSITACGRCEVCAEQVTEHRDVLLVAGIRSTQRVKLRAAGITTIDLLAESTEPVPGIPARTLASLRAQARLQVRQMRAADSAEGRLEVSYEVFNPTALAAIPAPSSGDIFFDFEGDPMWQDPATRDWGLEYLFGVVEAPVHGADPVFKPFWAHDRVQEGQALRDFLDYVADRRRRYPDMRIYHYADYERAALLRLAVRHGIGEDEVDDLLRANVLVDLYPIVRRSVRVSQPSYSIKKLEPLYMGERLRSGDVTTAGDSVVEYSVYCDERDRDDTAAADRRLAAIADYNEYDCISTLGLRDWLLGLAAQAGVAPEPLPPPTTAVPLTSTENAVVDELLAYATAAPGAARTPDQQAVALVGAAVGFHRREAKPYWWQHYDRLGAELGDISDSDAMLVEEVLVEADWNTPKRAKKAQRRLVLRGHLQPGAGFKAPSGGPRNPSCYLLYEAPHVSGMPDGGPGTRGYRRADIVDLRADADGYDRITVLERADKGKEHDDLPSLVTAPEGPPTVCIQTALDELAAQVAERIRRGETKLVLGPAGDLLLRRPPRMRGSAALPPVSDHDFTTAITAAVRALDGSALAVQGPPGTGKTYVAGRVIAALVASGWRIGVVSQGHSAVNQLLDGVVKAGTEPSRVGKKNRPASSDWTELDSKPAFGAFLAEHADGCVVGGTAWDFTDADKVGRGALDLLVVDEAGQFSLAHTIAVSVSAQRMLLLGDPQQLPQVSQGTHPEPVDSSALGWLSAGHTLAPELGYFLDTSWRMHPDVTKSVSALSYEKRLGANEEVTTARAMVTSEGETVDPGVFGVQVEHRGNAVEAPQEAAVVADLVQRALTWRWRDPEHDADLRPMTADDILVVAPYNAQRTRIEGELASRGIRGVRVGTVDKFQGQEAPLTILSMTASDSAEVPRGMGFLLSPNRLNVAVSRAQWRSVIVHSPALSDYLPACVEDLADLGGFLGLVEG